MKRLDRLAGGTGLACSLAACLGAAVPAAAAEGTAAPEGEIRSVEGNALPSGKLLFNLRPRYEFVDQDGRPEDGRALTLRTLFGWEMQPVHGFSLVIQGIHVGHLGVDDFNDDPALNAASPYPLIADPEVLDVNQLYLDYSGVEDVRLRFGRQIIKLGNSRMVGNGEFRQTMQVFDAGTLRWNPVEKAEVFAGHVFSVRNTLGNDVDSRTDLVRVDYRYAPESSLSAYLLLQDQPKTGSATGLADNSNRIAGIRANGGWPLGGERKLLYNAEFAKQDEYSQGDSRIDAYYARVGTMFWWRPLHVSIDMEVLSSNDGLYGFQMPLGNNHLFQGWADQFVSTPAQGLRDIYLFLGGGVGKWHWHAEYHRFRSDQGGLDLGRELDLGILYEWSRHLTLRAELARYSQGDVLTGPVRPRDITKAWLTLIYDFGGFPANSRPFER